MTRRKSTSNTSQDRGPAKFGWCMTDQHELCRVEYTCTLTGQDRRCPCECHSSPQPNKKSTRRKRPSRPTKS